MRPLSSFRLLRAGAFGAVCVALSVCGHDLMAPAPAPWWAPAAGLVAITAGAYALASRQRSFVAILVGVESVQVLLHLFFTFSAAAAPAAAGHIVMIDGVPMCTMRAGHDALMSVLPPWAMTGAGMLLAHAAAGALAALWLRRGERAAWRLVTLIGDVVFGAVRRAASLLAALLAAREDAGPSVSLSLGRSEGVASSIGALRHTLDRRGPPRLAACPLPALP